MPAKRFFILSFLVAATSLTVIVGCEGPEGPQGPAGPVLVYVVARVDVPGYRSYSSYARVEVYNSPGIPSVNINDILLYRRDPSYFSHTDFPISEGDSAELLVTYTKTDGNPGIAQANIVMPEPFEITVPDTSRDTISFGDSIIVGWSSSEGAEIYSLEFYFQFYYVDTSGTQQSFYYSIDTLLTDTLIVFPPSVLFPSAGEIDSMMYGYGNFEIWAVNGPIRENDFGNITGDGIGFFTGNTLGGNLRIYCNSSDSLANEIIEPPNPMHKFYR